jgi:hypothetical protein
MRQEEDFFLEKENQKTFIWLGQHRRRPLGPEGAGNN